MTVQVLDPEAAMQRDLDKKKAFATHTVEIVKTEFVREYLRDFGKLPDLTNPMINMFYNAWIAAQGNRQWLTQQELHEMKRRQIANEKRKKTAWQSRDKKRRAK